MADPVAYEKEILDFWDKNKVFEKSVEQRKGKKQFVFYDGPPFATGLPHHGHLLASTTKDTIPRYWTMKGFCVERVWGWDCHGLPIENIAEKELKIRHKKQIEEFGIVKFNEFCRGKVLMYAQEWKKAVHRLGRWVEFDNSYKTMDTNYIESVWWAFKQLWQKGFLYEGKKVLLYCARCETPISHFEVAMDNSYKDVTEKTLYVKFKLRKDQNTSVLAWTTTPWTLFGNVGLAVNPALDYVKIEQDEEYFWLAKDTLPLVAPGAKIVETVPGKALLGLEYEPLYPVHEKSKALIIVDGGEGITATDGTGVMHVALYGELDYELIKKYDLPLIQHIDATGHVMYGQWKGLWFKDLDKDVSLDLKQRNLVFKEQMYTHSYPFCYRCETTLFYHAIPAWFINVQRVKARLLELNEQMNWYPAHLKFGRFKNTLETAPDWNISRNRYWATSIPVWRCHKCGETVVVGSVEELKKLASDFPKVVDLHKHVMDEVHIPCAKCKSMMCRIPEVMDCWVESASMPFAQMHYPFENKDKFEKSFPGHFVSEYIAQTRAWFYVSLVISGILFDKPPFLNVLTTGTFLAADGTKMSKSKRNFTDPFILLEKYGADAFRLYMLSSAVMRGEAVRFEDKGVGEVYRKFTLLFTNVLNFYKLYAVNAESVTQFSHLLDRWVLARLHQMIADITQHMDAYNVVDACNVLFLFIDDLSTWFVRRSRDRFKSDDENQEAAACLRLVLQEFSKVAAPLAPFVAEKVFQETKSAKSKLSVHLEEWPSADVKLINKDVLDTMARTREIVKLALAERDTAKIPVKQALAKLEITGAEIPKEYTDLIADEINVKSVVCKSGKELSVKLDTVLTPELEAEGFARDVVRRIQQLRKQAGLKPTDIVSVKIECTPAAQKKLHAHIQSMTKQVGASQVEFASPAQLPHKEESIIKEEKMMIGLEKEQ
ncbi:isoleucine--tRNA ligase [Candidatus Woesearchaeota archaeon]|nr:isoleucine--tRNA ligase [Candidatus Woesearchaeota archaeon]